MAKSVGGEVGDRGVARNEVEEVIFDMEASVALWRCARLTVSALGAWKG